jgi:hypothetical protein
MLVTLTDSGEVFVFDSCLELVKLPTLSNAEVGQIATVGRSICGISKDLKYLYEWGKPDLHGSPVKPVDNSGSPCGLLTWTATVIKLDR